MQSASGGPGSTAEQGPSTTSNLPPPPASPTHQVLAAVTGSVAATILIGLVGTSPEGKLAGAMVGAAIPTFATVFLSRRTLHLGVAAAITVAALVLVYGGAFAFDAAADKQTFPRPGPTPTPTPSPSPTATATGTPNARGPEIKVTPEELACTADECERKVEVSNAGDKPLLIGNVTITGDAAAEFAPSEGCAASQLGADDRCEVEVKFVPTQEPGPRTASLDIASNDGTASVELTGDVATPDVDLAAGPQTCEIEGQLLTYSFKVVRAQGQFEGPVKVTAKAPGFETPLEKSVVVQVEGTAVITLVLPPSAGDVDIGAVIDSDNKVAETRDDNNVLGQTCIRANGG